MVAVSHYLSLSGGKKKSKIQDSNPRHDEVRCLIVNIITVSGVSLPEMILHCEIQNGPLSPDGGHMPLSFPVTKILLWHNINIRDVTQCSVILQIKLDLSRLVTGRVLSLYTFISGPKEVSGETRVVKEFLFDWTNTRGDWW